MLVKNFLAGDYAIPVPVGLQVTIQYSKEGVIEKLFNSNEPKNVIDSKFLDVWVRNAISPTTIPIKKGTTWVTGVLYTKKHFSETGNLPACIATNIVDDFIQNPEDYRFYAGYVNSLATMFIGPAPIRQWLDMHKFNVLPGIIIPANPSVNSVKPLIDNIYKFDETDIAGWIIYRTREVIFQSTGISQFVVSKTVKYTDENGYIHLKMYKQGTDGDNCVVDISRLAHHSIGRNSVVVIDETNNILNVYSDNDKYLTDEINCEFCGRPIDLTKNCLTCCSDDHCTSRLYPRIRRLLNKLNLPEISYEKFKSYVDDREIRYAPDVLDTPEYSQFRISANAADIIDSLIPISAQFNSDTVDRFVNRCKNNLQTIRYYIENPNKIITGLDLDPRYATPMKLWLSDPENTSELIQLLENPNITINSNLRQFNALPILHDKVIYITGVFNHGTHDTIKAILQSYSGIVADKYNNSVQCIVTGDVLDGIDGSAIKSARANNIPIFTESEFFTKYDIDSDLVENLL